MKFQGSLIKEQGVTFAIVIVKPNIIDNSDKTDADNMIISFRSVFGIIPIILMAQDSRGIPTYYGRKDIVKFLSNINISRIPWKEYTI